MKLGVERLLRAIVLGEKRSREWMELEIDRH